MSRVWITSDLHIGQDREFLYKERGFASIEEHDAKLLENWNSLVEPEDTVYILGDVMLRHNEEDNDFAYGLAILEQLKGRLIILRGNHDSESKLQKYRTCANVVSAGDAALYLDYEEENKYHFYLTHYPTLVSHKKLKSMRSALMNIYGHTHQKEHFYKGHPYMYCACLDAHDMKPVLLDDIIEEIRTRKSAYREDEQEDDGIR